MNRLILALALLAWLVPALAPAEGPPLDCARCHQNPNLTPSLKNAIGVPRGLYIDPQAFQESWHYTLGKKTECILCHQGITAFPHQDVKPLNCIDCHNDDLKPMFEDIAAELQGSVHAQLECIDCHDVHQNKPAVAMTLAEKNQGCLKCHQYGISAGHALDLSPIPLEAYHAWNPQAALHLERMACVVCHTDLQTGRERKHQILDKSHATGECAACHSGDSKVVRYLIDVGPGAKEGVTPEQMLSRIYLVGGTKNRWLELGGLALLLLTVVGVAGHGLGRIALARRPR